MASIFRISLFSMTLDHKVSYLYLIKGSVILTLSYLITTNTCRSIFLIKSFAEFSAIECIGSQINAQHIPGNYAPPLPFQRWTSVTVTVAVTRSVRTTRGITPVTASLDSSSTTRTSRHVSVILCTDSATRLSNSVPQKFYTTAQTGLGVVSLSDFPYTRTL